MPIQSDVRAYRVMLRRTDPGGSSFIARQFFAVVQAADDDHARAEAKMLEEKLNGMFAVVEVSRADGTECPSWARRPHSGRY
jgi:hypothetical protein